MAELGHNVILNRRLKCRLYLREVCITITLPPSLPPFLPPFFITNRQWVFNKRIFIQRVLPRSIHMSVRPSISR